MFGGQHLLGKGEFNVNFWVYDTLRERWERKSRMPYCRRHFETCVVDNKVFITGGIGNYRIIQDNGFFYDYKMDVWSQIRTIPQVKCCSFLNKCFFFSLVQKRGFFWELDHPTQIFVDVDVSVDEEILKCQTDYAVFSYKEKFFIKGKYCICLISFNYLLLKIYNQ